MQRLCNPEDATLVQLLVALSMSKSIEPVTFSPSISTEKSACKIHGHMKIMCNGPWGAYFSHVENHTKAPLLSSMQKLMPCKLLHAYKTTSSSLERLQIDASNDICAVQHRRACRHAICLYQKVCTPVFALLKHACKAALQPHFALHARTNLCHAAL